MFYDKENKLEIKKIWKISNMWKLNITVLNNASTKIGIGKGVRRYFAHNKNKIQHIKISDKQ